MKFYYSVETTPLKFHKAFYKVLSPIFMGVQGLVLLGTIGHLSSDNGLYNPAMLVLNLIISCIAITILAFITYGFAKKKQYAWYMVYAYLILNVSSNIISATQTPNPAVAVGQIIGALIIPSLIGIYYYKRKPIFVTASNGNFGGSSQHMMVQSTIDFPKKDVINYCRKCGNRVTHDSVFCNKCGTKIDRN